MSLSWNPTIDGGLKEYGNGPSYPDEWTEEFAQAEADKASRCEGWPFTVEWVEWPHVVECVTKRLDDDTTLWSLGWYGVGKPVE